MRGVNPEEEKVGRICRKGFKPGMRVRGDGTSVKTPLLPL